MHALSTPRIDGPMTTPTHEEHVEYINQHARKIDSMLDAWVQDARNMFANKPREAADYYDEPGDLRKFFSFLSEAKPTINQKRLDAYNQRRADYEKKVADMPEAGMILTRMYLADEAAHPGDPAYSPEGVSKRPVDKDPVLQAVRRFNFVIPFGKEPGEGASKEELAKFSVMAARYNRSVATYNALREGTLTSDKTPLLDDQLYMLSTQSHVRDAAQMMRWSGSRWKQEQQKNNEKGDTFDDNYANPREIMEGALKFQFDKSVARYYTAVSEEVAAHPAFNNLGPVPSQNSSLGDKVFAQVAATQPKPTIEQLAQLDKLYMQDSVRDKARELKAGKITEEAFETHCAVIIGHNDDYALLRPMNEAAAHFVYHRMESNEMLGAAPAAGAPPAQAKKAAPAKKQAAR